jgi:hypothetical protein
MSNKQVQSPGSSLVLGGIAVSVVKRSVAYGVGDGPLMFSDSRSAYSLLAHIPSLNKSAE